MMRIQHTIIHTQKFNSTFLNRIKNTETWNIQTEASSSYTGTINDTSGYIVWLKKGDLLCYTYKT